MEVLENLLSRRAPGFALRTLKRSRILAALAWRGLRLWQDVSGSAPNVLKQLRRMEPAPPAGAGPRVLFFSLRGWPTHLAWETTLARALHLRGAETLTVLCDRTLPACEPRTVENDFASTCDLCVRQSGAFLERAGLPFSWLSNELQAAEIEQAAATVEPMDLVSLQAVEVEGVPVGRLVAASVGRHLLRGSTDVTPEYVAAYRRFVAAGILVARASRRLLHRFRPDRVVVLNGLFYAEAILMYMAREDGIVVWAYERGKRLDSLIFARGEAVVRKSFDAAWQQRRERPLTPGQDEALETYVASRFSGNVGIERLWTRQERVESPQEVRPTAVLFTNVLWDTAMFDSDLAFPSMMDWIRHTIDWFAGEPDRRLLIRVHPAEVRVPFKRSRDRVTDRLSGTRLPPNVQVLPPESPANSYDLLAQADVVLAYASTIGLEAALKGVPTIVAGRTHYRGRGFTLDPLDPDDFDGALVRAFEEGSMEPARIELARRYAYLYFFEDIVPFPLVREEPRSYVTLSYASNSDLAQGRERSLDTICQAILTDSAMSNPHA